MVVYTKESGEMEWLMEEVLSSMLKDPLTMESGKTICNMDTVAKLGVKARLSLKEITFRERKTVRDDMNGPMEASTRENSSIASSKVKVSDFNQKNILLA